MNGTVSVYFNTGFNGVDIPADPSVLELCPKKVYPDVYYVREDIDKPSIKIKDTYENLCNVDYCKIETANKTCYYFAAPASLAQGVTQLSLDLDALLTMGGAKNINYISGWQERGHITKAEDKLFHNIASESWTPSNPLRAVHVSNLPVHENRTGDVHLVMTNIDFKSLGKLDDSVMDVITGEIEGDPKMYLPKIKTPPVEDSTEFKVWDSAGDQYKSFTTPGTVLYELDNEKIRKGVNKLYSAGQLQLQASYTIPREYIDDYNTEMEKEMYTMTGLFISVAGAHYTVNASNIPFEYSPTGYTVKNKKCLETYRTFVLVNLGSGDMSIKQPHEIYNPDYPTANPKIRVWADPTSTGKPYARFDYIRDNPLQWSDTVKGLQWANAQLSLEGASGSMWNSIANAFKSQSIEKDRAQGNLDNQYAFAANRRAIIGARIGAISDAQKNMLNFSEGLGNFFSGSMSGGLAESGSGFDSGLNSAVRGGMQMVSAMYNEKIIKETLSRVTLPNLINEQQQLMDNNGLRAERYNQAVNENQIELYKNNNVVAPGLMFTPEQNLGLYGYNRFAIYEVRKDDDDLKSEDMYYQRFGYSGLHRPLTAECFNARQYYSYVQAFNINIEASSQFGLRVRQKAISQLNSGVRVWKVVPNPSYYESN